MNQPILVTIPLSAPDLGLAESLLRHISHLGPILNHAVLFVVDHGLNKEQYAPLLNLAQSVFPAGGELIHTPIPMTPAYPQAHNFRFECAARHIAANRKVPWLWLDPRCVPTRKGWLIELETEYFAHLRQKPFMGQLLTPATHGTAQDLVSSTAIYPAELPKRMTQRLIAQRGTDWEKSCADLVVPLTHPTLLIWNHSLNGTKDLPKPPSVASIVHTAQARRFAAQLRGEVPKAAEKVPQISPVEKPVEIVPPKSPPPQSKPLARAGYYHSGNFGDIIYALAAIKLAGGGKLYLGPRSKRTPPPSNPIHQNEFDLIQPLLSAQSYLTQVTYSDRYPGTDKAFDLNTYRNIWSDEEQRKKFNLKTIVAMHCHILGVLEQFHPNQTWLTVPVPIKTNMFTVHRSPRYQNPDFPWDMVRSELKGKMLFVGLPQEYAEFQRQHKCKAAFWQCNDFLELAQVIAGSLGFIGNQSFPCAMALGLGVPVCQETWPTAPDCLIPRANVLAEKFTVSQFKTWAEL